MSIPLGPAELLLLAGADAATFAHAQFTSDVKSMAVGSWQWSAWLDAQGRTRNFFALLHTDSSRFIAWLPLGGAEAMREALGRFVMRSAVKLETLSGWTLDSLADQPTALPLPGQLAAHAGGYAFAQPGSPQRMMRMAPARPAPIDATALERWRLDDIAAGLPLLAPQLGGEFVPQALDLERLDAIRFDKGCYPGQEIAARLHFRGGNKRHLQRIRMHDAKPAIGTPVLDGDGRQIGQVLYAAAAIAPASEALAVLMQNETSRLMLPSGQHAESIPLQ
jgi:folate-binding protein YgfZ